MDIPREPKSKKGRYVWITLGAIAVIVITILLRRLEPASPTVEEAMIWSGMVERGDMLRQVRGNGNLVPENIVLISSVTAGRVEEVLVLPGAEVEPRTILLRLDNPDVELDALEAQRRLTVAEGELATLRGSLELQIMNQEATLLQTQNQLKNAERLLASYEETRADVSTNDYLRAKDNVEELKIRLDVETKTLERLRQRQVYEIAAKESEVARLKDIAEFQRNRFESLNVRAGTVGVIRELDLDVGQYVGSGQRLGVIIQPGRLKAQVQVQENQARDVVIGQPAAVDTRPLKIAGHVTRIDPAARAGMVTVDIALDEQAPQGVYADQAVDAVITIESLEDVMYVSRPINVQQNQKAGMFKVVDDGAAAVRVVIEFGRSSVDKIEIVRGVEVGDELILSDMSRWDEYDRVRIRR